MIAKEQIRKEVKAYLKPVRKLMKFSKETKETLYMTVDGCAIDFLNANPKATMDDVHELWGRPEEWVTQFLDSGKAEEVDKFHRRGKIILAAGIGLAAIVALILVYCFMYQFSNITIVDYPVR